MVSPSLQRGRFSQVAAYYAITTATEQRRPLFVEPRLARPAELELQATARSYGIEPVAWVLMPEHLHIVLRLNHGAPSRAIQAFKSRTARAINAARGTTGTVWQAGFYDHCIRSEDDLVTQARYVIGNPVRRGLVEHLHDYPYWWCRWMERPTPGAL